MSEKIKILMLGDTTSGKTCYMLGMYAAMQAGGGFSLKAINEDEGIRLTNLWSTIVNERGEDRWPPTTNEAQTYNFQFCYGYNPLRDFEWLDYRGGAMFDLSNKTDVQILRNYIAQSSCLFLCISGQHLTNPVTNPNIARILTQTKADLMGNYLGGLGRSIRLEKRKDFPIVIIVTKYDCCLHRPKTELIEDVKKMFPPLFAKDSGWLVMICPTSLGRELAPDSDNGEIEPFNLHIPVVFALFCVLTELKQSQEDKATEIEDRLEELENSNMRIFNGGKIRRLEESLARAQNQLQSTEEMIRVLGRELSKIFSPIYLSGEKTEIDSSQL